MKDVWAAMGRGEVVVGHWVVSGSPVLIEALGGTGVDFVAIDCEHGPISPWGAELDACIRAACAAGVAPVVRVSSHDGAQIAKAADLGARGVIVPHVNSAAELTALLAHGRFPPTGTRGCHPLVRASRYGATPWTTVLRESEELFTIVPLLEEPAAFEQLDELLDVDGLRAVAIGPFDLAARLGGVGDPGAEAQVAALHARLVDACGARGISVMDGAGDAETLRRKVDAGCRGILWSIDVAVVADGVRRHVDAVREHVAVGSA
jgi:2-keto-3-deoxy-L-rhamnonate aldolase RhmA